MFVFTCVFEFRRCIFKFVFTFNSQAVRSGVLSWANGPRRAGWVARGSELGARGWSWEPAGRMGGTLCRAPAFAQFEKVYTLHSDVVILCWVLALALHHAQLRKVYSIACTCLIAIQLSD